MAFTVGELSKLTGVTVRALHHYDELGLVRPSQRTDAGYRLYDERDVLRLHEVLLLRELGLPLQEIAAALDEARAGGAGWAAQADRLRRHRDALVAKRQRLDAMLSAVEARLAAYERSPTMSENRDPDPMTPDELKALFGGFDPAQYEEEARQRWGHTEAYRESARRTKRYGQAEWAQYLREAAAIDARLVELMRAGAPVTDPAVQAAVEEHRLLIDRWFYPCPVEMHKGLGEMYVADPRFTANLDQRAPGYARYLSDAIAASPPRG